MTDLKFKDFINNNPSMHENNFSNVLLKDLPLAMSYVPMQTIGVLYNDEEGLCRGTIFPELDKPFRGKFTGEGK